VFALNAHGDGARFFVGSEFDFVAVLQGHPAGIGQRIVFGVLDRTGVAHDADMGGLGARLGDFDKVGHSPGGVIKLETPGVFRQAAHLERVLARGNKNYIAISQLDEGHTSFQQELIKADCGAGLVAALDLHIEEGTALKVDAAGLVDVMQQAVHAGAAIQAGTVDEAADLVTHA